MQLLSDNCVDFFLFLSRSDLDLIRYVCKRFNVIVAERLKLSCLRRITTAHVSLLGDSNLFAACAAIGDDSRRFDYDTLEDALDRLAILTSSACVRNLFVTNVRVEDGTLECVKNVNFNTVFVRLYFRRCDLTTLGESGVYKVIQRYAFFFVGVDNCKNDTEFADMTLRSFELDRKT